MSLSDEPEHEESPAPMMVPAMLKAVVVAFVEVALMPVKFWSVVEPATRRSPVELMVVVAVLPKYAVPTLEKLVVDAPAAKSWRAVQVFAALSDTPPPPPPTHVPLIEKHPAVMLKPFAAVDVAELPVRFRYVAERPFTNVDVAPPWTT